MEGALLLPAAWLFLPTPYVLGLAAGSHRWGHGSHTAQLLLCNPRFRMERDGWAVRRAYWYSLGLGWAVLRQKEMQEQVSLCTQSTRAHSGQTPTSPSPLILCIPPHFSILLFILGWLFCRLLGHVSLNSSICSYGLPVSSPSGHAPCDSRQSWWDSCMKLHRTTSGLNSEH